MNISIWNILVLIILSITLSPTSLAKKSKKKKEESAPKAALTARNAPTPREIEQTTMKLISVSLLDGDRAHWVNETIPDIPPADMLIVESPSASSKTLGNILVFSAPGLYPYQARWYPQLGNALTKGGWHVLSIGLPEQPTQQNLLRSQIESQKDATQETLLKAREEESSKEQITWENQALLRGQLLTTFSASNNTGKQNILIGVGLSAHIASLIAAEDGAQLTGLVIIDLESPAIPSATELLEKLSKQGPILEIVTSQDSNIIRAAKLRKNMAAQSGNNDYRLTFSPPGIRLNGAPQSWLATTIHGWASAYTQSD